MSWDVKGKDDTIKATVYALEYNGEWMGESYVSVTIESPTPIDFAIGDYLMYRGERFEINYDPGKIKSAPQFAKGDAFKYENVKFNSLADELTRCDFLDVVLGDNQLHFTGLPKFSFYGGVQDLTNRIQANLDRAYPNQWTVVVSPEYSGTKELNVSVDTQKVWDALSILVNDFETYFTIKGRTITIGAAGVPAGHLFKYGKGNGLYEIEQNAEADQAIVTRLRAYGSTRNLPHRYYNSLTGADGQKLIPDNMAVQNLMLPSFPYTTQDPYIDSANKAALGIREGTIFFDGSQEGLEEIYPSIEGMTAEQLKAAGVPCNSTGALDVLVSAEQMTDDGVGEISEDGSQTTANPVTFKVTLKDLGFDINDHLTAETATMSFKTGMLGGRDFEIVKCTPIKNASDAVTGYELELNRVYDDSIKLWFPYKDYNAKTGDKFVLLHIEMPEVYIKAAAQRLLEAATAWLSKNDYSRSVYAPKVDEIFMARQHDEAMASGGSIASLHDTLKEGMMLLFEDEDLNIDASIFIDRLTIKEGDGPVPTYEVVLKEEKTVGRLDKMQNQIDSLASGGGQGGGYNASQIRSLIEAYGGSRFLSKLKDDRAKGKIASDMGFEIGNYLAGVSGGMFGMDKTDGQSFAEVFKLYVRGKAYFETLTIIEANTLAGKQYITPGGAIKCTKVEEVKNEAGTVTAYRCYFLSEQDGEKTETKIVAGDQAISEMFNAKTGTANKVSNHRYWRLVTAVDNDAYTDEGGNHYGYIDLSATDCETGSDIPQAGDVIDHLGNRTDKTRQAAMIFSTVDSDAPSIKLLTGINSYTLEGKAIIAQGYDSVKGHAYLNCYGDTYIGDPDGSTYVKYDQDTKQLDIKAKLNIASTIDGKTLNDYFTDLIPDLKQEDIEGFVNAIVDPKLEGIQNQIDGVIETWFFNGVPTLTNYPASGWTTEALKIAHLGDLYYDNDTGTAYRFSQNTDGSFYWNTITDDAITKALAAAQKAQDTADGKRRIFTSQPQAKDVYDVGDLWVNATYGTQYNNDILRCITHKDAGVAFSIAHWTLASKYTDDTALNNFITGYQTTIADIKTQVDGKAETWYQSTNPAVAWTTAADKAKHKGDLWYCTADIAGTNYKKGTTWYWNGTAWEKQDIPQSVFDTIDGKAEIFVSKPTSGYKKNDLWFLEADYILSNVAYKSGTLVVAIRDMGSAWSANDWTKKDRYTDDTLAQEAKNEIAGYKYLKEAIVNGASQFIGGLMLSSHIRLGEWNADKTAMSKVWAGMNGIYGSGRTIASWWGGDMVDLFDVNDAKINPVPLNAAKALVRMDGSAYFGNGSTVFKANGSGWLANGNVQYDTSGNTQFGKGDTAVTISTDGSVKLGNGILIDIGGQAQGLGNSIASVTTVVNAMQDVLVPVNDAGARVPWAQATRVKSTLPFYSESWISGRGVGSSAGGSGGGTAVNLLTSWGDYTAAMSTTHALSAGLGYDLYTRVGALEGGGSLSAFNLVQSGGGNAVTALSLSSDKKTLTVTKGSTFLPYTPLNGGLKPIADSGWGNSVGNTVAIWADNSGNCAFKFKKDNPSSGKISMLIDGTVYINEGSEPVASQNWVNTKVADYVTLSTAQTISGAKTFGTGAWIIQSSEANEITSRLMDNSTWGNNNGLAAIRNGIDFRFYDTHWVIGNIRSDSANSHGFGIGLLNSEGKLTPGLHVATWGIAAASFCRFGGTASQFLMADGSIKALSDITSTYVTALGTSGNYLTWTKNGAVNNITVPFATAAALLSGTGSSSVTSAPGDWMARLYVNVNGTTPGLFPVDNNANAILTISRHAGNHYSQLGFSSNGTIYYRSFNGAALNTTTAWASILTSANYTSTLDSRYVKKSGDTMTGALSIVMNGVTTAIESYNSSWSHFQTDAPSGFWFNNKVSVNGEIYAGTGYNQLVWHAGNDGSGSGLDADLLDGLHLDSVRGYRVNHPAINAALSVGNVPFNAFGMQHGTPIYNDPEFASGNNGVGTYNNAQNGNVTITRIADTQSSANSSGYILQIKVTGSASPFLGGFYQYINSRANAVFMQIFRAKIPVGYAVNTHANNIGANASDVWVTSQAGTGKWEWYARMVYCGTSGSFSTTGFVSLSGTTPTASAPLYWYLSHCQAWDLTKNNYGAFRAKFADALSTARTLWGQSFDGTGNVSGNMTGVGSITATSGITSNAADINTSVHSRAYWYGLGFSSDTGGQVSLGGYFGLNLFTASGMLTMLENGNCGFGTTSPAYKVDVNGTIRSNSLFIRDGYGGSSWNTGYGAYNTAISNNSSQTPLMVAYRAGQSPDVTGANRLFSLELLNSGANLWFNFGGANKFKMTNGGQFEATSIKLGSITISVNSNNGALEIDGAAYTTGWFSAKGVGSSAGGTGGSVNFLTAWSSYTSSMANTYALSAGLGYDLHTRLQNVYTKTTCDGRYGSTLAISGSTLTLKSPDGTSLKSVTLPTSSGTTGSYLPLSGGTLTGDLRLKDSTNYGRSLLFGDGSYCYLKEDTDDHLTIYASKGINLSVGSGYNVTINGAAISSGGSSSGSYLPLSGGTMTGKITTPNDTDVFGNTYFRISSGQYNPYIKFNISTYSSTSWYIQEYYDSNRGVGLFIGTTIANSMLINNAGSVFIPEYLSVKGTAVTSDARLKTVIGNVSLTMEQIAHAPAYYFYWRKNGERSAGSIAQYWRTYLPEVVLENPDKMLGLDYSRAALLSAIVTARRVLTVESRMLTAEERIESLTAEVTELKEKLNQYETNNITPNDNEKES